EFGDPGGVIISPPVGDIRLPAALAADTAPGAVISIRFPPMGSCVPGMAEGTFCRKFETDEELASGPARSAPTAGTPPVPAPAVHVGTASTTGAAVVPSPSALAPP